jgi:hypothetical protein
VHRPARQILRIASPAPATPLFPFLFFTFFQFFFLTTLTHLSSLSSGSEFFTNMNSPPLNQILQNRMNSVLFPHVSLSYKALAPPRLILFQKLETLARFELCPSPPFCWSTGARSSPPSTSLPPLYPILLGTLLRPDPFPPRTGAPERREAPPEPAAHCRLQPPFAADSGSERARRGNHHDCRYRRSPSAIRPSPKSAGVAAEPPFSSSR